MNILVIGSGGREHALAWRLAQSPSVTRVFAAPGNPGIAEVATCLPMASADVAQYLRLAEENAIDLTIVGPEAPLIDGVVDLFQQAGRAIFGPTAKAAQLEGSKVFAKDFFARHGIPTARYATATTEAEALEAIAQFETPIVLKADGLAAGKGVVICGDREEARETARQFLAGEMVGAAGSRLVIEEFLTGEEVSFICITDGETVLPLLPAQDHKAIFDEDRGPNTGGMGAYVDARILTAAQHQQVMREIIEPTIRGMAAEGNPFSGFLYAGLMMTAAGPRILEYNVRMGDPETQPLMTALRSDLAAVLSAAAAGRLAGTTLSWADQPALAVILAASGYPGKVRTGDPISGIAEAEATGAKVFQAGTALREGQLVTSGGRVLAVTATGATLPEAIAAAYAGVAPIAFSGQQYRKDIGRKGLLRW